MSVHGSIFTISGAVQCLSNGDLIFGVGHGAPTISQSIRDKRKMKGILRVRKSRDTEGRGKVFKGRNDWSRDSANTEIEMQHATNGNFKAFSIMRWSQSGAAGVKLSGGRKGGVCGQDCVRDPAQSTRDYQCQKCVNREGEERERERERKRERGEREQRVNSKSLYVEFP